MDRFALALFELLDLRLDRLLLKEKPLHLDSAVLAVLEFIFAAHALERALMARRPLVLFDLRWLAMVYGFLWAPVHSTSPQTKSEPGVLFNTPSEVP